MRTLDQQNRVIIFEKNSEHLFYATAWFRDYIVTPFLTSRMESIACPPPVQRPKSSAASRSNNKSRCYHLKKSPIKFDCFVLRTKTTGGEKCDCLPAKEASSTRTSLKSVCFSSKQTDHGSASKSKLK